MERIPHKDNQIVSYSFVVGIPTTLNTLNQPRNTGKCAIPLFLFVIPSCCSTGNDVSDTQGRPDGRNMTLSFIRFGLNALTKCHTTLSF